LLHTVHTPHAVQPTKVLVLDTMAPPAYLLVFSDPGEAVSEEEFNDWYDTEHVPLRLEVPAFQNWTRWKANDGQKPGWAAAYDLSSYAETQQAPYNQLIGKASEREKRIMGSLGVMERRTYELTDAPVPPPSELYHEGKPPRFIVFVSADVAPGGEEVFHKWYNEEHIPMLSKLPGWVRSRRFELKDWLRAGVEGKTNQTPVPKYLTVHEWESLETATSPEVQKTFDTPLRDEYHKVVQNRQFRVFAYYKHWEKK
jgi:hypothetical protein